MLTSTKYSTLSSPPSTLQSDVSFAMSTPSAHSTPTTTHSSEVASLNGPRRAYNQVMAKLRAGLTSLKLKTKKTKTATGGQLAPVAADAPAEKFGRPTRAIFLPDSYYGWEHTAKISATFITGLFDCPSTLPGTSPEYPDLAQFIAYALFLCQFEPEVNDYAMCLLWRLKVKCPDIKLTQGHGMYLAALGLAAKIAAHEDCLPESWPMVGQWIFSAEQLKANERHLGDLLLWQLGFDWEEVAKVMEHARREEQPDVESNPLPPDNFGGDGDCADSIRSISTSSSLSTCTISSTWSLRSMRGWDESARKDSAVTTAPGEKVNTHPYIDLESWRSLPAFNASERSVSSPDLFGD